MNSSKLLSNEKIKIKFDWIDLAKGLGMVLIIFAHSMEWFSSDIGVKTYLLPIIYSFHLPLFFFISGFLFSTKKSFKEFLIKLLRRFVVPYITFSIIIVFVDAFKIFVLKSNDNIDFKDEIFKLITQNHFNHLWFLVALMFVELFGFFICKVKKTKILILMLVLSFFLSYFYTEYISVKLIFSLDEVFYAFPLFLFGYIFRYLNLYEKLLDAKYSALYLVLGGFFGVLNLKINQNLRYINMFKCHFGNIILFYLTAFFTVFFVLSVCKIINKIYILNYVGKNSLVYYGIHMIIFQFIFHFLQPIFDGSTLFFILFCVISTVVVMLLATIVNIIFTKTKLCWLMGNKIIT